MLRFLKLLLFFKDVDIVLMFLLVNVVVVFVVSLFYIFDLGWQSRFWNVYVSVFLGIF